MERLKKNFSGCSFSIYSPFFCRFKVQGLYKYEYKCTVSGSLVRSGARVAEVSYWFTEVAKIFLSH